MDTPAQHVAAQLSAALRPISGAKITAFGVTAEGTPVESWQAVAIQFKAELPVSEATGKRIAAVIRDVGVRDITAVSFTGFVAASSTAKMMRLTGRVDDAIVPRLATLELDFSREELAAADVLMRRARKDAGHVAEKVAARQGKELRRCAQCGDPIGPDRSSGAKTCSLRCQKLLMRAARLAVLAREK